MRGMLRFVAVLSVSLGTAALAGTVPDGISVPKDVKLPTDVSVAIYLPAQLRRIKFHSIVPGIGAFQSDRTVEDTVMSAANIFFSTSHMAEAGSDTPFGLMLALHPEFKSESGQPIYTMNYTVFAADNSPLLKGEESLSLNSLGGGGDLLDRASLRITEQVMAIVVRGLRPDQGKFPANLSLKSRPLDFVANRDKPFASGTGFYFNAAGQIMTAAHVVHDCVALEVSHDGKALPGKVIASSNLLDLAVVDAGIAAERFLPFRRDTNFELGEAVTNVSYPLQSILAASPNLTRGNVSSRGGLSGSVGQFQFSAPIQPGASGGPVVSDGGELLGITLATMNAMALAKQGAIPQNLNFALDARYAALFLSKSNLTFTSVDPNPRGDMHTANEAALSAVLSIRCYE